MTKTNKAILAYLSLFTLLACQVTTPSINDSKPIQIKENTLNSSKPLIEKVETIPSNNQTPIPSQIPNTSLITPNPTTLPSIIPTSVPTTIITSTPSPTVIQTNSPSNISNNTAPTPSPTPIPFQGTIILNNPVISGTDTSFSVYLSWNAINNAKNYQLYRNNTLFKVITENSINDENLTSDTYSYYVTACDLNNNCTIVSDTKLVTKPKPVTIDNIVTIAGGGKTQSYGLPATSVSLIFPSGINVDSLGNIYLTEPEFLSYVNMIDTNGIFKVAIKDHANDFNNCEDIFVDSTNKTTLITESFGGVVKKWSLDTGSSTIIAGDGTEGFSGDGDLATKAKLHWAKSSAVDSNGNIYISDYANHRIRKVDKISGIISTFAGSGDVGFGKGSYSGDGEKASNAKLYYPMHINFDSEDNLYIPDSGNNVIRKVDKNGIISTIAGSGIKGYTGDGEKAINAQLNSPLGIVTDKLGNIYIVDTGNKRIRKVDKNGIISTITNLQGTDIDIDPTGKKLYLADPFNKKVIQVKIN